MNGLSPPPGLSPRVRGNPVLAVLEIQRDGSIPVPAGSARRGHGRGNRALVHPRLCGVCGVLVHPNYTLEGSSPFPRGLLEHHRPIVISPRFIPVPAGSAVSTIHSLTKGEVHPRSRGVCRGSARPLCHFLGSSPFPRGLRCVSTVGTGQLRFIPVPAGSASSRSHRVGETEVHPRSRGVCLPAGQVGLLESGSSPFPRGLHSCACGNPLSRRFIPVPAGSAARS